MLKPLTICIIIILALIQYRIWFTHDGINNTFRLKREVKQQEQKNAELEQKNANLAIEIAALKKGGAAIENRARNELGMVKKGETFFQVID